MLVLVEDAAQALASSYVEAGDLPWIGDRLGQEAQQAGVREALVRPMRVENRSNSHRACSRWRRFQIKVRSSSSRRQVRTHLSLIAFIRGTRTPLSTTSSGFSPATCWPRAYTARRYRRHPRLAGTGPRTGSAVYRPQHPRRTGPARGPGTRRGVVPEADPRSGAARHRAPSLRPGNGAVAPARGELSPHSSGVQPPEPRQPEQRRPNDRKTGSRTGAVRERKSRCR